MGSLNGRVGDAVGVADFDDPQPAGSDLAIECGAPGAVAGREAGQIGFEIGKRDQRAPSRLPSSEIAALQCLLN